MAHLLVDQARDGVVQALGELRDLVRGIGPPVLRDRGLAAALEAVTARSPIPVTLDVALPRRPSRDGRNRRVLRDLRMPR